MQLSPFKVFSQTQWAQLGALTSIDLSIEDLKKILSFNDKLMFEEVKTVYLPLTQLILKYISAYQSLQLDTQAFLGSNDKPMPFIIGVAGSVAVGKSTTSRLLQELLSQLAPHLKTDLITTDGFLHPNMILKERDILNRKGFPESYNRGALLAFLAKVKAGENKVKAPVYSHLVYDIVPGEFIEIKRPDILIVEGLNVLQPGQLPADGQEIPFVSDYFDFSIYVDAEKNVIQNWYISRFMRLRETAFRKPESYFHRFATLNEEEAYNTALSLWSEINLINLVENIIPTRQRADLIIKKEDDHHISTLSLRRL